MRDGTLRRLARGLGALAVLVLLLVGIPFALAVLVGWPLPRGLPSWDEFRSALTTPGPGDDVIVKGLAVVCWMAWAVLAASVAAEVAGVVRGRRSRRIPFAGPVQALAANLVAAAVLTLSPPAARAPSSAPPLAAVLSVPRDLSFVASVSAEPSGPAPEPAAVAPTASEPAAREQYTVVRRDTLWGIAEARLGDPFRWPELFDLNQGRPQPDGHSLTDPNLIRPGWVLLLPAAGAAPTADQPSPSVEGEPRSGVGIGGTPMPTLPPTTTAATSPTSLPPGDGPAAAEARPVDGRQTPGTDQQRPRDPGEGIHLPAGSFVGLSLAAGISAALVAARLHKRRRRMPEPPGDGIAFKEPIGTEAVRRLRRADLATQAGGAGKGTHSAHRFRPETSAGPRPASDVPNVAVGVRSGEPAVLDLMTVGGVGLTGPGAANVARSLILDFASNATAQTAEVIIAGPALAERLFPGVESFAGMEVADDVAAAVSRLEVELVHRTRLIDDNDDADFPSYVAQNPVEPLPVVLLVADEVRGGLRLRLDAVASVGRRLGIGTLLLSPPPNVATISVGYGASVEDVTAPAVLGHLQGAHLFSIEPSEAREMLDLLAAGRGAFGEEDAAAATGSEPFPVEETSVGGTVAVHLLGTYRIEVNGEEIRTGLRTKARELLAFLLLHPQGKSVEATVDTIWPDADLARGTEGFRTAVGNVRKILRTATGNANAAVIERVGERYRVEASLFDCDLWRMEDALRDAKLSDSGADGKAALERASKEFGGDLLDGVYYEWAEAPREDVRRRSIDALVKLSALKAGDGANEAAVAALAEATRLDPYAEEVYRRLMALQLELGQNDASVRTYKQLECRLAEIDADPGESTAELAARARRGSATAPSAGGR